MPEGVHIKFCGLTRHQDVELAVRLGADFLGFVFVAGSPRGLDVDAAVSLLSTIDVGGARRVGVFRDQPATDVNAIVRRCGLDLVQLHGHEPRDYPLALETPAIRVLRARAPEPHPGGASVAAAASALAGAEPGPRGAGRRLPLAPNVFAALIDAEDAAGRSGGLGLRALPGEIERVLETLPAHTRVFLSGGLTPENVAALASRFRPYGVDVSSGVERAPGVKDPARMQAFVKALRGGT